MSVRNIFWLGFFAFILWAWWTLFTMSSGMGLDLIGRPGAMATATGDMNPSKNMRMPMAEFWPLFCMWALMMAAMMLPTLVPTLLSYQDLMVSADGNPVGILGVVLGYFLIWLGFAALITWAQLGLLFGGVVDMLGIARSPWVAGGLLIAVGAFQFSRIKHTCYGVCRSPMMYFLGHWRVGLAGGLRMGLGLGAFCVGCCWGFMALGFVGGVMSLLWMGLATVFMVVEKLPQVGYYVKKPMGYTLILAGTGWILTPVVIGG